MDRVGITKRRRAVVKLVPARPRFRADRAQAFDDLETFAKTVKVRRFNLRKVIEHGRR